MAYTFSYNLPMGIKAPDFQLTDVRTNTQMSLADVQSKYATLIMFICNHCPYVRYINAGIAALANDYQALGVSFVAISANDAEAFPDDGPEYLKKQAIDNGFNFPYLYDVTQQVAKAYRAACTPDFYIFDKDLKLAYHGRMDGSNHKNLEPNTGNDIRKALDSVIKGQPFLEEQLPSGGCNIKWKAGVSPF
ncbi:MAG: thioredoxin family protein [Prolixibacteraceae bacterium]|nr:thioredoxin family protein [Prolixibacteraceae bacterium]